MPRLTRESMKAVYAAADRFVNAALREDDSLFTPGRKIWSLPVLNDLKQRFTDSPDTSKSSFEEKFARQLAGAPADTIQLAGELVFVYFLASRGVGADTKRDLIESVLNWSPSPVSIPPELSPALEDGVANAGTAFNTKRPFIVSYLLLLAIAWHRKTAEQRAELLSDPWKFKTFAFEGEGQSAQTMQHALLHLVFPETFEGLTSQKWKKKIVEKFGDRVTDRPKDVDRALSAVRAALSDTYGAGFNFYDPVVRDQWMDAGRDDDDEGAEPAKAQSPARANTPQAPPALRTKPESILSQTEPALTPRAFELLTQLHAEPTRDFVYRHSDELKSAVTEPFQRLFKHVIRQLPQDLIEPFETESRLFGRFQKNDWGRGGAWDYYWGAIYLKGSSRIEGLQLFARMDYDQFTFGFSFGDPKSQGAKSFAALCSEKAKSLTGVLAERWSGLDFHFGPRLATTDGAFDEAALAAGRDLAAWLQDPTAEDPSVRVTLLPREVTAMPAATLADRIVAAFRALQPLVLLATEGSAAAALQEPIEEDDETASDESDTYTLAEMADETGLPEETLATWAAALERKGQAILYGPPGTGKTHMAQQLARHLTKGKAGYVELVQFHPAYAYEDFMQGIRPRVGSGQALQFDVVAGRFLEFCRKAREYRGVAVLIVDEINRANLARVFGELMYLLEYRNATMSLAAGGTFRIPGNVRIIGTMNTADRSIALVDHALRRRFAFLPLRPDYDVLRRYHERGRTGFDTEPLVAVLKALNKAIGDEHYEVGISFFLRPTLRDELRDVWRMEIEPYLEEYFFDQGDKVASFRWDRVKGTLLA